jgi:predicted ester cyclase
MTDAEPTNTGGADPAEQHVAIVRRLVEEVMHEGRLEVIEELYAPELTPAARAWIAPFLASFPDTRMKIIDVVATDDRVVARFKCSGTHLGDWLGHPPTGRRFAGIDEVYFFRFHDGQITHAWGIEDTLRRLEQLGLR